MVIPKIYNGRNKTFFFANLELDRNFTVGTGYQTMPTTAERTGDFSQALVQKTLGTNINGGAILQNMIFDPNTNTTVNGQITRTPFPGNVIPTSRLNAVALTIQNNWMRASHEWQFGEQLVPSCSDYGEAAHPQSQDRPEHRR